MPSLSLCSLTAFASRFAISKTHAVALLAALAWGSSLSALTASGSPHTPADRLNHPIQESVRVALQGTMHPLAVPANDRGMVSDAMKLDRVQIVLRRSDAQEAALKQSIRDRHTSGSASYHKWLTPAEFGKQFGPSDADVEKLQSWLSSHGFSVIGLTPGRQTLEIAGTAGQFRDAFHAEIHKYQVKGSVGSLETHFANASAPEIPAAIAPVFGGFVSLNNFRLKRQAHVLGKAQYNRATHESKPDWTYINASNLVLAPGDLAVQYDLNRLYTAGTRGDGQSIAVVNDSNINIAQVNNYRALFGLPFNPPQVIIDGNDPGIDAINSPFGPNGDSFEAYLDVELSGAVAPNAQINLVIADSTALEDGLTLAIQRAVNSNISPVLSLSFSGCEADQGSYNAFINSVWEQAAAQGITVLVSTGDAGSAACDNDATQDFAVYGQAVNALASTPYNVAVGGTDFYYSGGSSDLGKYWNLTPTNSTPTVSLKSKVPEQPFNTSQYGLNLFDYYAESGDTHTSIFTAGGGASSAGLLVSGGTYGPYPKPSWQTGAGVPNDHARDLPDVSLFGALDSSASYTPICAEDGDCESGSSTVRISGVGGTSVSAPGFAGIMALVNQRYGRQGQANYVLYPLATQVPSAFNDVTVGNISVPCAIQTVYDASNSNAVIAPKNCQPVSSPLTVTDERFGSSTEGQIAFAANTPAYSATAGYDLASGLGSVDAYNLITNWTTVTLGATTTTLTPSLSSFTHGTAITVSGTVSGNSPSGDVALVTTSAEPGQQGAGYFTLSGGAYTDTVNTLPGGSYTISGYYGGDGSNAPSTSVPVSITVTPEASTTALTIYSALNYPPQPGSPPAVLASGGSVSYGAPVTLRAQAAPSAGSVTARPTGNVVFSDGSTPAYTAVVNAEGDAEYNAAPVPGAHSFTALYSGDASYTGSTSAATSFTVTKNTPDFFTFGPIIDQNQNALNGAIYYLTVQVENSSSSNALALAPSGTVTVSGAPAGTPSTATLVPAVDPYNSAPEGTAIFAIPATASGSYTLNFSYAGDANYAATTGTQPLTFDTPIGLTSTVTATASASATSPNSLVPVTVTITGQAGRGAPTGRLQLLTSGYLVGQSNPLPTVSTGNSVAVTFNFNSAALYQGTNQITAQYYGDSIYKPSAAILTIENPLSDFSLVPLTTIISVPVAGASAAVQTDGINLSSYNGFTGPVALTCSASGGVTCSFTSTSVTLTGGGNGSTTLSLNTSAVTTPGTYSVLVTGTDSTGRYVHTVGLQVIIPPLAVSTAPGFTLSPNPATVAIAAPGNPGNTVITATPANGFTGTIALTCAVTASPVGATSLPTCSAATESITGTSAATATLTFNTVAATAAGSYTVIVTGTSGSVTAATSVIVTVPAATTSGTFSLTPGPAIAIASPGQSGTSNVTVTHTGGGPVTVSLTCAVTTAVSGATNSPACSFATQSATVSDTITVLAVLTVTTTAQTTARLYPPARSLFTVGEGIALAALLVFGIPVGRRGRQTLRAVRTLRILSMALFFALLAGAAIGCGSGGADGGSGGTTPTGGTTPGAYTVTVTATPASGTPQTTTITLNVQ